MSTARPGRLAQSPRPVGGIPTRDQQPALRDWSRPHRLT